MLQNIDHETLESKNAEPCLQVVVQGETTTILACKELATTLLAGATILPTMLGEKQIEVAAAIFWREREANKDESGKVIPEVLLTLRPKGRVYAGFWEFPGGKIEDGETSEKALVREIQEELGVEIHQPFKVANREYDYKHAYVKLHFFVVKSWSGTLQLCEHDGMIWQSINNITVTPILPANDGLLEEIATN